MGPTVVLGEAKVLPQSTPISMMMIASVVAVVALAVVGMVILSWYFRRGDQALQKRLSQLQKDRPMILPGEETPL